MDYFRALPWSGRACGPWGGAAQAGFVVGQRSRPERTLCRAGHLRGRTNHSLALVAPEAGLTIRRWQVNAAGTDAVGLATQLECWIKLLDGDSSERLTDGRMAGSSPPTFWPDASGTATHGRTCLQRAGAIWGLSCLASVLSEMPASDSHTRAVAAGPPHREFVRIPVHGMRYLYGVQDG